MCKFSNGFKIKIRFKVSMFILFKINKVQRFNTLKFTK